MGFADDITRLIDEQTKAAVRPRPRSGSASGSVSRPEFNEVVEALQGALIGQRAAIHALAREIEKLRAS
jgi:hypothetical protein